MHLASRNRLLVQATERIPSALRRATFGRLHQAAEQRRVEGIDIFCRPAAVRKRALLTLSPEAWRAANREYPGITRFNPIGLTFEIVRALNLRDYLVDIVDYHRPHVPDADRYDLVVAHGPYCRGLIESIPPTTFVIQYASGAYWKAFNEMSRERYQDFCLRRGLAQTSEFVRTFQGAEEGEELLARRADATFIPGPRTLSTWIGVSKRPKVVYLGAYLESDLVVDRDFESGRRRFVYVAGTGGNVQKGLDVLLEAFSRNPDLHLYIYCKVEDEILRAYGDVLALSNIHYIYHLRFGLLRSRLIRLLKSINFTITAPIDTGPGTAFVGSLGLGLIPVGYVDIDGSPEEGCFSESWRIEDIEAAIKVASEKPLGWCQNASSMAIKRYRRNHDPSTFGGKFCEFHDEVFAGQ